MVEYVEIAVNVPRVSGVFHYHCPPELEGRLHPGHLVLVPFGARTVQGVMVRQVDSPEVPETKAVDSLLDEEPVLTNLQLQLASYLAESTLAPLAACVNLMLPPGIGQLADLLYEVAPAGKIFDGKLGAAQERLWKVLKARGPLRGRQLDRALPRRNWRASVKALQHKGLVSIKPVVPLPSAHPKTVRTAELSASQTPADEKQLGRNQATRTRRAKMLKILESDAGAVDATWLYEESGGKLQDLTALAELGLVQLSERETFRDPLSELAYNLSLPLELTRDQTRAWDEVHKALARANAGELPRPILLHGVTGSGKTEIYLQAVAKALALGRQAIVLVPEIALTPQAAQRFLARFPGQVGLIHSELSEGERYDTWRRARAGQLNVILGPRSALFTPLKDIGLIVVDEEHDDSYYEATQEPHYHAREAAVAYARLARAACLMGSATPDVGSYTRTVNGLWQLLELPARILAHRETARAHQERLGRPARYQQLGANVDALDLPPVEIVDMRRELKAGNRSIFSRALQTGLEQVLKDGQQAILFLNRRGSATYVFCRDCGQVLRCPNCDTPLTQHLERGASLRQNRAAILICHHCGYRRKLPERCPNCGSAQIRHFGTGTERVEEEVHKLFPSARTLRWDRSSTRTKGAHERILRQFSEQQADILIGTQMLAKGLDLPFVTLVGVVLADVGLQLPDYRAAERVFQVLTQVAGRAGRSPLGGQVILQTFHPEHYAIQAAAKHDYAAFYEQESAERRRLRYPPFAQLLRLEYRHADAHKAEQDAHSMAERIQHLLVEGQRSNTETIGPAPCFYARLNREYRWQILLRGPEPASLLLGVKLIGWRIEVSPPTVL